MGYIRIQDIKQVPLYEPENEHGIKMVNSDGRIFWIWTYREDHLDYKYDQRKWKSTKVVVTKESEDLQKK